MDSQRPPKSCFLDQARSDRYLRAERLCGADRLALGRHGETVVHSDRLHLGSGTVDAPVAH